MPFKDYWLTLLFKRLVGPRVLKVAVIPRDTHVRIYAHCDARRFVPGFASPCTLIFAALL
jgi:hypothetical protein